MTRKLYAWQEGGKWCLSWFKREAGRPRNEYDSQQEIVIEASNRGVPVEWLQ